MSQTTALLLLMPRPSLKRPWLAWTVTRRSYGLTFRVVGESRGNELTAAHPDILYDNSHPTPLAEHLWILGQLLLMKYPPGNGGPATDMTWFQYLHSYVITTCYPKMERRL